MPPGISGLSLSLPPYRVQLQDWCAWNDESWEKTRSVVGRSFRMRGPSQSVYTLAANAVRLPAPQGAAMFGPITVEKANA